MQLNEATPPVSKKLSSTCNPRSSSEDLVVPSTSSQTTLVSKTLNNQLDSDGVGKLQSDIRPHLPVHKKMHDSQKRRIDKLLK